MSNQIEMKLCSCTAAVSGSGLCTDFAFGNIHLISEIILLDCIDEKRVIPKVFIFSTILRRVKRYANIKLCLGVSYLDQFSISLEKNYTF